MRTLALCLLLGAFGTVAGCTSTTPPTSVLSAHVNDREKFSSSAYGVKASKRRTRGRQVKRGGGRRQTGRPYTIAGKRYRPRLDPNYRRSGLASWYGPNFHGRETANGETYDQYALSAAHPTMPLPSYARVTNLKNGRSTIVRVNDRGPYTGGRIIDLSAAAADLLDYRSAGVAKVRVTYVGPAPLDGRDVKYLAGSFEDRSGLLARKGRRVLVGTDGKRLSDRFIIPAYAQIASKSGAAMSEDYGANIVSGTARQ